MSKKSSPPAYDCYANAEPDEDMFILLARDKHAPALVLLWALLRELDGEDPAKVEEARRCAADMQKWALSKGRQPLTLFQLVESLSLTGRSTQQPGAEAR